MNTNNIQKVNYQKILDKITDKIEKECAEGENRPALFPISHQKQNIPKG